MIVPYLSASRISTFDQCQLKYHAIYDLEKKGVEHPLTILGKAVHKAIEIATKARKLNMRNGCKTRVNLTNPLSLIQPVCVKYKVDSDLWSLASELISNAIEWGYFRKVYRTEWCEIPFFLDIGHGVFIKGFIDRLDLFGLNADVIDLKTQKVEFSNKELEDNWQARVYNVATRMLYPEVTGEVTVSFWVLRHRVQRISLTAEDAEIDRVMLINKAIEIRSVEIPTASPSGLCPWCANYADCASAKEGVKAKFKRKRL